MESGFFIGRDSELELFISEISESDQFKDPSRIFYLSGSEGIGKTSFYSYLWKHLRSTPLQVLWIRPQPWMHLNAEYEWANLLAEAMDANTDTLRARVEAFKTQWAASPKVLQEHGGAVAPGQDPHMAAWFEMFAQSILGANSLDDIKSNPNLRVVFVLDDYDRLSAQKKTWFAHSVFERLIGVVPDLDVRFLLSGRQSFYQSLDIESYWGPFQSEVREIQMHPLASHETFEFGRRAKLLLSDDFDLHEASGGIPGKIMEILEQGPQQGGELHRVKEVENILGGLSDEYRNWILGAVHLRVFNDESLNIFGSHAGARKACKWLQDQDYLKIESTSLGFRIDPSLADAVLHWQEQYNPQQYRKLAGRVESFREVCQNIPEREHREKLAKLSILNFFNEELVHKVFEEGASSLNTFVRSYLKYFIKTPFNYQISMQYQPFVQNYVRLIPIEDKELLQEKANYLWEKRRESVAEELKAIESKLKKEKEAYQENRSKLDPIIRDIGNRTRLLSRMSRKQNMPSRIKAPEILKGKQPGMLCLFFNTIGLIMLCIGLLYHSVDMNYILLGALFVMFGIFWPENEEVSVPQKPTKPAITDTQKNLIDGDTLIGMLNLKRVGFENRSSYLSMLIARYQRRIRELDTILQEPYVR